MVEHSDSTASSRRLRARRRVLIVSAAAFLTACVAEGIRILRVITDGADPAHGLEIGGLTVAVVVFAVVLLILAAKHRNARRLHALSTMHPDAFVGEFFAGAELLDAVAALRSSGQVQGKLPLNTLVGVTVDRTDVRFYDGGARPRMLLALPSARITRVTSGVCPTVRGTFPCINLTLQTTDGEADLPLLFGRAMAYTARRRMRQRATQVAEKVTEHLRGAIPSPSEGRRLPQVVADTPVGPTSTDNRPRKAPGYDDTGTKSVP